MSKVIIIGGGAAGMFAALGAMKNWVKKYISREKADAI